MSSPVASLIDRWSVRSKAEAIIECTFSGDSVRSFWILNTISAKGCCFLTFTWQPGNPEQANPSLSLEEVEYFVDYFADNDVIRNLFIKTYV